MDATPTAAVASTAVVTTPGMAIIAAPIFCDAGQADSNCMGVFPAEAVAELEPKPLKTRRLAGWGCAENTAAGWIPRHLRLGRLCRQAQGNLLCYKP